MAASSSAADGSAVVLPEDVPSPWAIEEVTQAIVLGMVPSNLQSRWRHSVTRIEFAQMVVHFLAFQYGYDDDGSFLGVYCSSALDRDGMPFGNSSSWWNQFCGQLETFCDLAKPEDRGYGNAAYALGIVNGRGAGTFDPNGLITRQEAAAMLMRCYRRYGGAYDAADPSAALTDWNSVADWAQGGRGRRAGAGRDERHVGDHVWSPGHLYPGTGSGHAAAPVRQRTGKPQQPESARHVTPLRIIEHVLEWRRIRFSSILQ